MGVKKIFALAALASVLAGAIAQKNPYSGADEATAALLERVDKLIEQQQYESAFAAVSGGENEYVLAKQIEICINYFSQSMMHQMFAFKNLAPGETLHDVRGGTGEFSMVMFNPVEAVAAFKKKNGEKPILDYALGLYYDDVLSRYGEQWLVSEEELVSNTIEYLQKAFDGDCYDSYSLSVLGLAYYRLGDVVHARTVYEKKIDAGFALSADDCFNLGAICYRMNDFEKALEYAAQSIEKYDDSPEYQSDAYIVCVRICIAMQHYAQAKKYLSECKARFPNDYRIVQQTIAVNAR